MTGGTMSLVAEERALAARLRRLRKSAGLSQEEVAAAMGQVRSVVSAIENGRRKVSGSEVRRLARIYEVDAGWLLTGEDPGGGGPLAKAVRQLSLEEVRELVRYAEFLAAKVVKAGEQHEDSDQPRG